MKKLKAQYNQFQYCNSQRLYETIIHVYYFDFQNLQLNKGLIDQNL